MAGAVLILGAAGGIGSALAEILSGGNGSMVLAGRTSGKLDELAGRVGGVARAIDATDIDAVDALVQETAQAHGPLTGMVTFASTS